MRSGQSPPSPVSEPPDTRPGGTSDDSSRDRRPLLRRLAEQARRLRRCSACRGLRLTGPVASFDTADGYRAMAAGGRTGGDELRRPSPVRQRQRRLLDHRLGAGDPRPRADDLRRAGSKSRTASSYAASSRACSSVCPTSGPRSSRQRSSTSARSDELRTPRACRAGPLVDGHAAVRVHLGESTGRPLAARPPA
jgi:hypothetical protein